MRLPEGVLLACLAQLSAAAVLSPRQASINATAQPVTGFVVPSTNGGRMLTYADGTGGLGEPINIIVSSDSAPEVLGDQMIYWFGSLGYSGNCLGLQADTKQQANLGDGNGIVNETSVIRWNYGDFNFGSCSQTINGGPHFRYWVQNGPRADTGALFMASSVEMDLANGHMIVPNGYDMNRDAIVGNATAVTSFRGWQFNATATTIQGLLPTGTQGINHAIPIDGNVTLLTVSVLARPNTASGAFTVLPTHFSTLLLASSLAVLLPLLCSAAMLSR